MGGARRAGCGGERADAMRWRFSRFYCEHIVYPTANKAKGYLKNLNDSIFGRIIGGAVVRCSAGNGF